MTFLKLAKFFLYASVFAVALVATNTYFPFIGVKYYYFRWMVELALISVLIWWGFQGGDWGRRLKEAYRGPIVIAVTAFAAIYCLSALFAYDASAAIWSNFERGEGAFQMLHYYGFFILMVTLFKEEKEWRVLFGLSVAAAGLMILYGIAAAAGLPGFVGPYYQGGQGIADGVWGNLAATRFQGSLGNPAYVSIYLIFVSFYLAWLWFTRKNSPASNIGFGFIAAIFVLFFWLAQTRGALIGLMAGAGAYLFYLIFWSNIRKVRWSALAVLSALVVLGGLAISYRNTQFINSIPGNRVFSINVRESSFQTRLWTWNSAWRGFLDRPILGWGPENFSAVFDKYFDPRHFVPGQNTETWFDRAHSVIFDYLAGTGIFGLLSYLAVFAATYWTMWRKIWRKHSHLTGLLVAMPVAYFVQGLVLFDVMPMYINWFVLVAFAGFISTHPKYAEEPK